jgi:methylated-DNA-[protein]-cysteine S-methyltransferase
MKFHPSTVHATYESPLGPMILAASDLGLNGLWFEGQKHFPHDVFAHLYPNSLHPMLQKTKQWLDAYFSAAPPKTSRKDLAFDLSGGTAFQQSVWQALLTIELGQTEGYGGLAQRIGSPAAARAVGAAVGKNPISLIIPCHRVVGAQGALTGYAGGVERKAWLLRHEGALPADLLGAT